MEGRASLSGAGSRERAPPLFVSNEPGYRKLEAAMDATGAAVLSLGARLCGCEGDGVHEKPHLLLLARGAKGHCRSYQLRGGAAYRATRQEGFSLRRADQQSRAAPEFRPQQRPAGRYAHLLPGLSIVDAGHRVGPFQDRTIHRKWQDSKQDGGVPPRTRDRATFARRRTCRLAH